MITGNYTFTEDLAFDITGPAGRCTVSPDDQGHYQISGDPDYAAPLGSALEEAARRTAGPAGHPHLDTTDLVVGDLIDVLFPHAEPFTRNLTQLLAGAADELGWEPITDRDVEIFRLAIIELLPAGLTLLDDDTIVADLHLLAPSYQPGCIEQQITAWCHLRHLRHDLINEADQLDPQQLAAA